MTLPTGRIVHPVAEAPTVHSRIADLTIAGSDGLENGGGVSGEDVHTGVGGTRRPAVGASRRHVRRTRV